MTLNIELVEQETQTVIFIRTRTSFADMPKLIGESYCKITAYLGELGEQPAGMPYAAYYNLDMQDMDLEMGFPVARQLPGKGEIKPGIIPAGKYVTCLYQGPYSQMERAYNEIFKWLQENNRELTGVYYEYYYNSPDEVPESELLTKIAIPVK
jgi:effector-binding domain-containing protein